MNVEKSAWRALFAAQLGWMLDAMDFLLFSYAIIPIQKEFALSKPVVGALFFGGLVRGAFGPIAHRIGRVRALTLSILVYSLATAGLATSGAVWQIVAWRALVG